MKKLITIQEHLVEPLLFLAAKEHKGNLHACIVDSLSKAVEANKSSSFLK
jgi:hypothetical protein